MKSFCLHINSTFVNKAFNSKLSTTNALYFEPSCTDDDDDDDNDDEKQPQWLTLQLCLVTVGVTEWIECSRLNHLF